MPEPTRPPTTPRPPEPDRPSFVFGPFRIDTAAGRLLRDGVPVRTRRKVYALLEFLVTRPGRLVSRDEILDAVWPDTHVTSAVLTTCIRELRRALGDEARTARFIETAHGRGYRFVAHPREAPARTAETPRSRALATRPDPDDELTMLARQFAEAVRRVVERTTA